MKRTVFYSWQSDLPSKQNRNLIEDALTRALRSIRRDESETIDPVLDRDTSGTPGSPAISDTIFRKISAADIFIADVSIINHTNTEKKTSNPNVLIELGFAISQLGWDRIILVQNSYFGGPEELPFDLRGRRVVTYNYGPEHEDKAGVRGLLQGRLESSLRTALTDSSYGTLPTGLNAPIWWGEWLNHKPGRSFGGRLFIRETTSTGFIFDLTVHSGSHLGHLTSEAIFVSRDMAYSRIKNGDSEELGEITFRRTINEGKRFLSIDETASCSYYRGMGVTFSGDFEWSSDHLFDFGFLNELDLERIYNTLGNYYFEFKSTMEGISESENLDDFEVKVFHGGVRGCYTSLEGIVMCGREGDIWIAYISDENVKYFTNRLDWKNKLPRTIEHWHERFNNLAITYVNEVNVLPANPYQS